MALHSSGNGYKARTISQHFVRTGIASADAMAAVECPVGVKIGSKSVMEIAVSIISRYIEKRSGVIAGSVPHNHISDLATDGGQTEDGKRKIKAPLDTK